METNKLDTKVKLIHGFSNKTRLLILESIKEDEKTVSQIVEEINGNQSNISQHLACLKDCGIIVGRNEGKYCYYSLRNEKVRSFLNMFDSVLEDVEDEVSCCKNYIV
ncbi:ArsR/SmtB family transcription factor [Alkalihalobacillus pseudalcaliphilus]|uniref:ArsR/SmtB family transcription factor n=1 Tax=Alkalihalobacillus pseudalcaliphilus TaxID=79884 RepID=UPI00064DACAA|nr:metalloregulator ArsR/SmtB family transcription factor [Alkalihalobacillus pseudalcaliphilus]KMK76312.1 ArsR family transcriptional regulator [Alkalihalobacillus pseudalcaliphilus]